MSQHDRRVKKDPATGLWMFVVDAPSPDGRRRQLKRRGFATAKAANDALATLLEQVGGGLPASNRGEQTLGVYLTDRWLPTLDGRDLRETTRDSYERITRLHLVPRLGGLKLSGVDESAIERMHGDLTRAGLSPKTIRNIHGTLSKALEDAVRWRLVGVNKARGAERPRRTRPTPKVWTRPQLQHFLERVTDDRLAPMWRFLMCTGCRRGEAVGLRWSDLDLDAGLVTIINQRTLARGRIAEGPPKSAAGVRLVGLDPETVTALTAWRRVQRAEHVALGVRPGPGRDYVFTSRDGGPIWPGTVTKNFQALCDELGLPRIGPHGLRHSHATHIIASGGDPKIVQARLGHADIAVTLGLYRHVMPTEDAAAAAAFAALLVTKTNPDVTSV